MSDLERILAEFKERGLSLSRDVLEDVIRDKRINRCPLCESSTSNRDNFGKELENNKYKIEVYCTSCNYIITLDLVINHCRDPYYNMVLSINTNSKNYRELIRTIIETKNGITQLNY